MHSNMDWPLLGRLTFSLFTCHNIGVPVIGGDSLWRRLGAVISTHKLCKCITRCDCPFFDLTTPPSLLTLKPNTSVSIALHFTCNNIQSLPLAVRASEEGWAPLELWFPILTSWVGPIFATPSWLQMLNFNETPATKYQFSDTPGVYISCYPGRHPQELFCGVSFVQSCRNNTQP